MPCFALCIATVLLIAVALGCGRTAESPPVVDPALISEVTAAIHQSSSDDEVIKQVSTVLEGMDDAGQVRVLAYVCDELLWDDSRGEEAHGGSEPDAAVSASRRKQNADQAWTLCLLRLRDMGRSGDEDAVRQLWLMSTSGRYDAGFGEWIDTCISEIGPPAIPVLEKVRGEYRELAQQIIRAIREGRVFE